MYSNLQIVSLLYSLVRVLNALIKENILLIRGYEKIKLWNLSYFASLFHSMPDSNIYVWYHFQKHQNYCFSFFETLVIIFIRCILL